MIFPTRHIDDAYGEELSQVLEHIRGPVAELAQRFTADFYDALASAAQTAHVLQQLGPAEFSELQRRQVQHLVRLLDPELNASGHQNLAERVGTAHALVGIDILWLIEAFSIYQYEIQKLLRPLVHQAEQRELLMRVVSRRILLDLEGQVASYRRLEIETARVLTQIDQLVLSAPNLPDLVRGALEAICSLDGDVVGFFARPDPDTRTLHIEASHGEAAERYQRSMEAARIPRISLDAHRPTGNGPGGRAWRSGEIVVSDSWAVESDSEPWRKVGAALGFRSSAGMPLLDASGRSIALISLYSAWPGYFSTLRVQNFLNHVQKVLSHALQQRGDAPVLPLRAQQVYRRLLEQGRVVMLYQPVISLRDGSLRKVEALARLRDDDDSLISPAQFLPALGADELRQLFKLGLRQACADCRQWDAHGLETHVSVNFPAEGLGDQRYEEILVHALSDYGLQPQRLTLEILETQDGEVRAEQRQAFIQRLRSLGIGLAQDDLGSGHSSLLRMDQYGFDEVKIDQGLVRGALRKPQRALEFVLYLTRLAHALNIPVTVEGLESPGMVEAAAILGADCGQGYGIARPMPAEELSAWERGRSFDCDVQKPRSALGAMAGYLLWDLQLAAITDWPNLVEEFAGTRCIVDAFIHANSLHGSDLAQLLRQNQALALSGPKSNIYQRTRARVIELLHDLWLSDPAQGAAVAAG